MSAVMRICPRHRIRHPASERCPSCPPRQRGWGWAHTAARVLVRDGHQCTAIVDGARCTATTELEVAHLDRRIDGGSDTDETRLTTLCHTHHQALERDQRADTIARSRSDYDDDEGRHGRSS
jgi:hypothetical protein